MLKTSIYWYNNLMVAYICGTCGMFKDVLAGSIQLNRVYVVNFFLVFLKSVFPHKCGCQNDDFPWYEA